MQSNNFGFSVPIFKADGEWRFTGRASTTSIDRQGERISENAIKGFKEQLGVALCMGDDHKAAVTSIASEIGMIDTVGGGINEFDIGGPIFKEHPYGSFVYSRLSNPNNPPNWKLSIGGKIPEGGKRMEWDPDAGMYVSVIDSIILDHVFLCRGNTAVNQDTWIEGKSEDWGDAIFKAASEIEINVESNKDLSSSHKAEDNLEADLMPDEVTPVPETAGDEKVSVGTLTSLIDVVKGLLVKSDEPAPEETTEVEEEPVAEKTEEPAQIYVTVEQMSKVIDGLKSDLIATLQSMLAEKSNKVVGESETPEEDTDEAKATEEKAEDADEGVVTVSKSEYEKLSALVAKAEEIIGAGGTSAQLPVISNVSKGGEDDGYPDVLGALTSHPVFGPSVAQSLGRLVTRR